MLYPPSYRLGLDGIQGMNRRCAALFSTQRLRGLVMIHLRVGGQRDIGNGLMILESECKALIEVVP